VQQNASRVHRHRSPSVHLNSPRVHMYALTEKSSTRMDLSIWARRPGIPIEPSTRTPYPC